MARAMIISVGGTPEPIVKTLQEHRPESVCFFCSEESIEGVGEIKRLTREIGVVMRNRNVMARDPQDLVACYRDALSAAARMEEEGIAPEDVVVDYTGGTKTMSVALALATVGKGYRFSYVGGKSRDKGGVGTVLTGSEEVRTGLSPWQLFAVEEKMAFAHLFNRHLFASAAEVIEPALRHDPTEKRLLESLVSLARGYQHWDAFRHKEAREALRSGCAELEIWLDQRGDGSLGEALRAAVQNLDFLNRLAQETRGFQRPHRLHVIDLLSNARRRAEVGRHDDAVARVYRALELLGQLAFHEAFGCATGSADPGCIPEALRKDYVTRYFAPEKGVLQIPLFAAFRALSEAGRLEGEQFRGAQGELDKLLYARNHSILAHGFQPVEPGLAERFEELVRTCFDVWETVVFPVLSF